LCLRGSRPARSLLLRPQGAAGR
jgi:undecaprenyl-diphosphatase